MVRAAQVGRPERFVQGRAPACFDRPREVVLQGHHRRARERRPQPAAVHLIPPPGSEQHRPYTGVVLVGRITRRHDEEALDGADRAEALGSSLFRIEVPNPPELARFLASLVDVPFIRSARERLPLAAQRALLAAFATPGPVSAMGAQTVTRAQDVVHDRIVEASFVLDVIQVHRTEHFTRLLIVPGYPYRQPRRKASPTAPDSLLIGIGLLARRIRRLCRQRLPVPQAFSVGDFFVQVDRPFPLHGRPCELRPLCDLSFPQLLPRRRRGRICLRSTGRLLYPALDQAAQRTPSRLQGSPAIFGHLLQVPQMGRASLIARRALGHQDDERIRNQGRLGTRIDNAGGQGVRVVPVHPHVHAGVAPQVRIQNAVRPVTLDEGPHRSERQLREEKRRHPEVAESAALANECLDRAYADGEQPGMPGAIPDAEKRQRPGHTQVLPDRVVRTARIGGKQIP